jgi:hypothetical protein
MNFGIARPLVTQPLITFPLAVPGAGPAVCLGPLFDKSHLITSFIISNPVAGSSVYLGGQGVTATGITEGLEISAGTAPNFRITQEGRQLYELQALAAVIAQLINCQPPVLEKIPFKVWDLSTLFLFSANAGGSQVTVAVFPEVYL